jgi:hypothetical protein
MFYHVSTRESGRGESPEPTCPTFTDLELQWFRGGVKVTEVIHVITEDDIVSETLTGEHNER